MCFSLLDLSSITQPDNISVSLILPGSTTNPSSFSTSIAMDNISTNLILPRSTMNPPSFTVGTAFRCTCRTCSTHRKGRNNQFGLEPHRHLAFPNFCTWDGRLRLRPRNYDCKDMTTGLIRIFERNPRRYRCSTHLQHRALARWQSWVESQRQMPTSQLALKHSIDLRFLFEIFDDYFFCGVLSEWTRVTWVGFDRNNSSVVGSADDDPALPGPYGLIKIANWRSVQPGGPSAIMKTLNTLLHEMVHSMLNTFTCRCRCASQTSGFTGHGPLWEKLARALEQELKHKFAGYGEWDLNIENALGREIVRCKKLGWSAG